MTDIPVRKSRFVFVSLTITIIGAIIATVLLANDRRHLTALLVYYGYMEAPQPAPPVAKKRRAPTAEEGDTVSLSGSGAERLFSGSGMTPFARIIRFPAPDMCALFTEHGFKGEGWQPSPMGEASECTAEKLIASGDEASGPAASLFVVIRGTAQDDITSLRIKMLAPPTPHGQTALKELDTTLAGLIEATGWSDLTPLRDRFMALEDVSMTDYSLSVTFKREFTNHDAYNLIIRPAATNPDSHRLERPSGSGVFNQTVSP